MQQYHAVGPSRSEEWESMEVGAKEAPTLIDEFSDGSALGTVSASHSKGGCNEWGGGSSLAWRD